MGLNIKNERVCALAKQAAQVTGKTQTSVIEEALLRLLRDYEVDPVAAELAARNARLDELLAVTRAELLRTGGPLDTEFLYDPETGLPA